MARDNYHPNSIPHAPAKVYDMGTIRKRVERLCADHRDQLDQGDFIRCSADFLDDIEWFVAQVKCGTTAPAPKKKAKPVKNRHAVEDLETADAL